MSQVATNSDTSTSGDNSFRGDPLARRTLFLIMFLLLFEHVLVNQLPFDRSFNWDYFWVDARNVGQAGTFANLISNFDFSLFAQNIEIGVDASVFQFNVLNPFNFLYFLGLEKWAIWLSIYVVKIFSCIAIIRILSAAGLPTKAKIGGAIFFIISPSLGHFLQNTPTLNTLLYIPIYLEFCLSVFSRQKVSWKRYSLIFLSSSLLCDIHFPIIALFVCGPILLISLFKNPGLEIIKNIGFFAATNFLSWIGWVLAVKNGLRDDSTFSSESNLASLSIFDFFSFEESRFIPFMVRWNIDQLIITPKLASGMLLYIPVFSTVIAAGILFFKKQNQAIGLWIIWTTLAIISSVFILNSDAVAKLGLSVSYFRLPLNLIPAFCWLIVGVAIFKQKKDQWLLSALMIAALIADAIFLVYGPHTFQATSQALIFFAALCGLCMAVPFTNRHSFVGNVAIVSLYVAAFASQKYILDERYHTTSVESFDKFKEFETCVFDLVDSSLPTRVLITGNSEWEPNSKRLYNSTNKFALEVFRGSGFNVLYGYRELIVTQLADAYRRKLGYYRGNIFTPSLELISSAQSLENLGVQTVLVFNDQQNRFEDLAGANYNRIGTCQSEDGPVKVYEASTLISAAYLSLANQKKYLRPSANHTWELAPIYEPTNLYLIMPAYRGLYVEVDGVKRNYEVDPNTGDLMFKLNQGDQHFSIIYRPISHQLMWINFIIFHVLFTVLVIAKLRPFFNKIRSGWSR